MLFDIITRIELLITRDKLDLAQQNLNDALSQFPDNSELHALQSEIYYKQKAYQKAGEAIDRAIGANPESDYAHYLKSRIYLAQESYKKADEEIDRAIALSPSRADYYGVKGSIKLSRGTLQEAMEIALKGLEIEADNLLCNNIVSMAQGRLGHKEAASDRISYMLEHDPENALTHANAGYQFLRQGNVAKAKEHFSVALQIEPTQEYAKAGMAEAMKSSNILYKKLLQFAFWIDKIGNRNKWVLYIGVILLVKVVPFLVPFYLVFIFWTWFTPPIANILLYFDQYGRYLLDEKERQLTIVNAALVSVSLIALTLSFFYGIHFLGLAFAFFIATLPVYRLNTNKKPKKYLMIGFIAVFIGIGITAWYLGFIAEGTIGNIGTYDLWVALMVAAMLFTWMA